MNAIKIKCPTCGKVLALQDKPGINSKEFTCPACKEKHIVGNCQRVIVKPKPTIASEETQYGSTPNYATGGEETQYSPAVSHAKGKEETDIIPTPIAKLGYIVDNLGKQYSLSLGINTVGRKANSSSATIQIDVNDRYMSRNHAIIEVRNAGGQIIHILKNGANKNPSYLNDQLLADGDQMILNNGDRIKLGMTTLTFKK